MRFPIRILDEFRFSPIFELSVQMDYPTRILEENICFGLIPKSDFGLIQIQSKFRIVCTPFGSDKKYSLLSVLLKRADSQIGFWTNSDPVQIFEVSVQMASPMRILEEDKDI